MGAHHCICGLFAWFMKMVILVQKFIVSFLLVPASFLGIVMWGAVDPESAVVRNMKVVKRKGDLWIVTDIPKENCWKLLWKSYLLISAILKFSNCWPLIFSIVFLSFFALLYLLVRPLLMVVLLASVLLSSIIFS